jgi:RNA polymerase sigma factor (sigma-70 family)
MDAFSEEELEELSKLVQKYARRFRLPSEDVEDCGQQFVVYLLERPPQERASIRARPNRSAHHFAVDYLRHHIAGQKCLEHLKQAAVRNLKTLNPDDLLLQQELHNRLEVCLACLCEKERALLVAHIVEQQSFVAIAKQQGRSAGAVRMAYNRAIAHLRAVAEANGLTEQEAIEYLVACYRARGGELRRPSHETERGFTKSRHPMCAFTFVNRSNNWKQKKCLSLSEEKPSRERHGV